MSRRLTEKEVKEFIEGQGYKWIGGEYKNTYSKLLLKCPNNHNYEVRVDSFKEGRRCQQCFVESIRLNVDRIKNYIESQGYKWVSGEYKNARSKLLLKCPNNHDYKTTYDNFKIHKCPQCHSENIRIEEEKKFKEFVEKQGYKWEEGKYKNSRSKILLKCPNNHDYEVRINSFKSGRRCPLCNNISKGEQKIMDVLNIHNILYTHDKLIWKENKLRPDFYLPDYNLIIEYDGKQHYESIEYFGGKEMLKLTQQKDKEKNDYCREHNINLLRIPYWEFNNIEAILKKELSLI